MTTYIWKSPTGNALDQVQVGAADVVATIAAANTAWGWVGGLEGVRSIISHFPKLRGLRGSGDFGIDLKLQPSSCRIITSFGISIFQDNDVQNAFGGHPITQLIGCTICALAHKLKSAQAVRLFMDHLANDILHGAQDGMIEALYSQLSDKAKLIINEGATRGLPKLFSDAIRNLHLPENPYSLPGAFSPFDQSDHMYLAGLLRWIQSGDERPYLTRSAVTVQVAACLKEIGYLIGTISVWNGIGESHEHHRGLVLVTGGPASTDRMMFVEGEIYDMGPVIHYYHQDTAGSTLFNLLGIRGGLLPQTYESYFHNVRRYLRQNLSFSWESSQDNSEASASGASIYAKPIWSNSQPLTSSMARSLASIHFPLLSEQLAPCYENIASEDVVRAVKEHSLQQNSSHVTEFNSISISILISFAEKLGGEGYHENEHAIQFAAIDSTIDELCRFLNKMMRGKMIFWQAVLFVAIFHCGASPTLLQQPSNLMGDIVGYRNRNLTVFPSLLVHMAPTESGLGLCCRDEFISLPVQDDNTIRSSDTETWNVEEVGSGRENDIIGPPTASPPDVDIYLSAERLVTIPEPFLCLTARCDGYSIGTTGICRVLKTLALSFSVPRQCPTQGHTVTTKALMIQASDWAKNQTIKRLDQQQYCNYIAVADNPRWALFLAGQAARQKGGGFLVFRCFECTVERARQLNLQQRWKSDAGGLFIGYGGSSFESNSSLELARR